MDPSHGAPGGAASLAPITESPSSSTSTLTNLGRKKALLIGIRSAEGYPELKAAHVDVQKMRALLIDFYHYASDDIRVLVDDGIDGHVQPTRANILQAIAELVKGVKDGDRLFFHYSGHSTQVDNQSNSEEDGKDECECAAELHKRLVKPLPVDAHLVAVLDTCHSGSLLDLPHYRCNRVLVPWINRGRRTSEDLRHWVVRRGARLLSLAGVHMSNDSTRSRPLCSILSVMCDPQASLNAPDADAQPTGTQVWFLEEDDPARRCDSPVERFPCTGWCRGGPVADEDEPGPDVISLSSCKDSQLTWEDDDGRKSMTSSLVDILNENPNRSLKEVLESVSYATYTMAVTRHERAKAQKRARKQYIRRVGRRIAGLERGRLSTPSLVHREPPVLVNSPTFPNKSKSLVARTADTLAKLKQTLREAPMWGGHDMDAFQNPELASYHPLDMDRLWRM
ncbi:caspase domain-containing protein [Mycena latifolia]|nr:caspase domain-containing protein [Mycena latifolia]